MSEHLMQDDLSSTEAARRLEQDGPNALPVSRPRNALNLLRGVVFEPMFLLLVACGAIYLLLGDQNEALMLLGFVFVVMAISFVQQRRTERSLEALRVLSSPVAVVVRDGLVSKVPAATVVCGDIVLIAEGDRIPADLLLLAATNLTVDESMLTGESVPVAKFAAAPDTPPDVTAPDTPQAIHQAYSGTLVTQGTARGRVIATGPRSTLGRIGQSLAAIGAQPTPVQAETARVVKQVAVAGLALAVCLALFYWLRLGDWLHGLLAGLTLAMAILPEELPVVLTIFLGLGAWRLAREKVLARSIPAIELLGATTVLCVDKTGTLTMNRMQLRALWCDDARYDTASDAAMALQEELHGVLEYAVLASHRRAFDPMETAIAAGGKRLLANTEHLHHDWTLVDDYPLSPEMLAMSRVWQSPDHSALLIAAKGAPEAIMDLCHLPPERCAAIARQVTAMANEGLRVLGVARAEFSTPVSPPVDSPVSAPVGSPVGSPVAQAVTTAVSAVAASGLPDKQHDFDFEFLGLVALEDPVRADVPEAIAQCRRAGMKVVMITGDHPSTARSIARQAGLTTDGTPITGAELETMDDAALAARLPLTHIFCRVQPAQKLRLVQAFRARGEVVAMTGDGVNDAPALKAADIGVAMGVRGTDVAREAAALVLLNDDFASLVTAVRHGRRVFANLRKAIAFIVAVHVPIVGLSFFPVLFGWPVLLMPVHILFLQLIIDPACSVVFEAEAIEPHAMAAPPRAADARLFDRDVLLRGLVQGGGLLAILLALSLALRAAGTDSAQERALTFIALVCSNLGLIFANRTWSGMSWTRAGAVNHAYRWSSVATLALLALAVGVPSVRTLFGFALPPAPLAALAMASALASTVWFEACKKMLNRRAVRANGQWDRSMP
ncbi:cation-translocating P-type ATPase [Rugamonas apoptosis]|uniref:P-type Cu(+) transporter n=1 Tax=Rugamonas apoptosis TaxID=2758570 RepID=A0A7W2F987_9BURK|nr:HAD-IC family P-type ATPase [Rugamonas apoptosis]MBA5687472.1 HAD-IC family P-type ATPase [Rugamonas apoptosis]